MSLPYIIKPDDDGMVSMAFSFEYLAGLFIQKRTRINQ